MRSISYATRIAATCLLAGAIASCEGVAVPVTLTLERDFFFQFDSNDGLTDTETITRQSILEDLDIPDDAQITNVSIELVRLELAPGTGNQVSSAGFSFSYEGQVISPAASVPIVASYSEPLDNLVANALTLIKTDLEEMVSEAPNAPQSMTMTGSVTSRTPTGARLVTDATITVRATVSFIACQDLSVLGLGPQGDCVVGGGG